MFYLDKPVHVDYCGLVCFGVAHDYEYSNAKKFTSFFIYIYKGLIFVNSSKYNDPFDPKVE